MNLETESEIYEYYKRIVGIEKDYRLSKVAKVSAFMYGQPDIQILYADALANNEKIRENSFNILVANPPYSVKGFLETLSEEDRKNIHYISKCRIFLQIEVLRRFLLREQINY